MKFHALQILKSLIVKSEFEVKDPNNNCYECIEFFMFYISSVICYPNIFVWTLYFVPQRFYFFLLLSLLQLLLLSSLLIIFLALFSPV